MGEFATSVRLHRVPGPHQRGFDRARWLEVLDDANRDTADRAIARTGIYFDRLLSAIRAEKCLDTLRLAPRDLLPLVVGLATADMVAINDLGRSEEAKRDAEILHISDALQQSVTLTSGERFTPDEVLGALGDGLRHLVREVRGGESDTHSAERATSAVIDQLVHEINVAIKYDVAVQYWMYVAGYGYEAKFSDDGVELYPGDQHDEVARIVSAYRRRNIVFHRFLLLAESWKHQLPRALQRVVHPFPVVTRVHGKHRIEGIELGWAHRQMFAAIFHLNERLEILEGPYKPFVDVPLDGHGGLSLRQLIDGWLVLQSLAQTVFEQLRDGERTLDRIISFAPRIPARILTATVARALQVDPPQVAAILEALTFKGERTQELWSQPLLQIDDDYLMVLPCVVMANLQRIADVWLRQGQIDLARRGEDFERYCVKRLNAAIRGSMLEEHSAAHGSIEFVTDDGIKEQIDLTLVVGDTVLILEAKCVLWPEEAMQQANYRSTLAHAASQVRRKQARVESNFAAFREAAEVKGLRLPENAHVIGAVLSNSSMLAGFALDGTPVTDLWLMEGFFLNDIVKAEVRAKGEVVERHSTRLYDSVGGAAQTLSHYLKNPPQIQNAVDAVAIRTVGFPHGHQSIEPLRVHTREVLIDGDRTLEAHRKASAKGAYD